MTGDILAEDQPPITCSYIQSIGMLVHSDNKRLLHPKMRQSCLYYIIELQYHTCPDTAKLFLVVFPKLLIKVILVNIIVLLIFAAECDPHLVVIVISKP